MDPAIQTQTLCCVIPPPSVSFRKDHWRKVRGRQLVQQVFWRKYFHTEKIQHELSHTTYNILRQLEMHKALRPEVRNHRTSRKHKRKLLDSGLGNNCLIHHSKSSNQKAKVKFRVCIRLIARLNTGVSVRLMTTKMEWQLPMWKDSIILYGKRLLSKCN